jgi:flavin reductase (DIM6/NTAB) family NADH-FMN oxidoreductase RutF
VPSIAVVGAGQAGTQLALGLLAAGCEVTLVSNRSPDDLAAGPVLSSQCMFESALRVERALGLARWDATCPPVEGISLTVPDGAGGTAVSWAARLDAPAQSVDQRLKLPAWTDELEARGGRLTIHEADVADLDRYAGRHDLVVVATGKGDLGRLFPRDAEKSPYDRPQRAVALTYVTGMTLRPEFSAVCFNLIPGVGEYFVFPALTASGPCEIMVFEGVPGGPMDCWEDVRTPAEHLARSLSILEELLPWEAARCRDVELTDANGVLTGRFAPSVRHPVAELPSGASVLGMADAVVLNDPITGQGSNNAAKCADIYLEAILERGEGSFDTAWMQDTFDRYWRGYAQWVTGWTNALLAPPRPHVLELLGAAGELPSLAATIVNGFDDPRSFYPWWFDEAEARRLIEERRLQAAHDRFDRRDLRRALGQFATGVTVITTRAGDGRRVGLTANSFTSLSLEPPLVLWCLAKGAPSAAEFLDCDHFAVNVLAADQHHLSRQFSTPAADKFAGVTVTDGVGGVPLLDGAIAHFTCRHTHHHDGGDHVIFIGEVERYEAFDGEPLVFHSGFYRVATRHPELDPAE